MEIAALAFFCAWALLSLFVYVPHLQRAIRTYDFFALVPEWRFFAPNPAREDYVLLYRDLDADGSCGDWHELAVASERRWWNVVWNPGKRGNKGLFDLVTMLSRHVTRGDPAIEVSSPYLGLLNAVSAEPRLVQPVQTQFMILKHSTLRDATDQRALYISGFHDV